MLERGAPYGDDRFIAGITKGNVDDDKVHERDARLLEMIILDNDATNDVGISERDISVCFEMSYRCGWGDRKSFSVSRYRRALRAMRLELVVKVGDRWFPRMSTNASRHLDSIDKTGHRICARRGCAVDITHSREGTKYCSSGCRNRARRQDQWSDLAVQTPRSGAVEERDFRESGPTDLAGDFSAVRATRDQLSGAAV